MSQQATNRSFDELARALASGSLSHRKALRLMAGVLVGPRCVPAVRVRVGA